jgi:hypothetical protein
MEQATRQIVWVEYVERSYFCSNNMSQDKWKEHTPLELDTTFLVISSSQSYKTFSKLFIIVQYWKQYQKLIKMYKI